MKKLILFSLLSTAVFAQKGVQLVHHQARQRVDVSIDGKPFTSYIYPGPEVLKKAVLYPIRTANGNFITRGWPMDPRPGERVDHPHHVGMWFNYGDVNGLDFWNNSTSVNSQGAYGTIVHTGVKSLKNGREKGELTVTADWLDKAGKPLLTEVTTYTFGGTASDRTIDHVTTLKAVGGDVTFKDNKEGMLAIRVARQLEHPSNKPEIFTDAAGVATKVAQLDNAGVTGNYRSSEGVEGEKVWGTRARWMNLTGTLNGETVSVVIMDHPQNVGYPTHWHARGYGLFAANPLAPSVMSGGKDKPLNFVLPAGKEVTFRHRILITSNPATEVSQRKAVQEFQR